MKTAEEWKQIWRSDKEIISAITFEERLTERIEKIQQDARYNALSEAAKVAYSIFHDKDKQSELLFKFIEKSNMKSECIGAGHVAKALLALRDKKES